MAMFNIFFTELLTFAVCLPALAPDRVLAMGPGSGLDQLHDKEGQEEQTGQRPEEDEGRKPGVQKENAREQKEKSAPEKKPRLKYRDPYECGC
jgi:hypothetical protein